MSLKRWSLLVVLAGLVGTLSGRAGAATIVIGFDNLTGMQPPFGPGQPVPFSMLVNDQYSSLGVLFSSGGGGLALTAASNCPSAPNCVSPTAAGPVMSYSTQASAAFFLGGIAAVVTSVSISLTDSSSAALLRAYDLNGALLASASGGPAAVISVVAPGIHSVTIDDGPFAFDNFTFSGLGAVPEPGALVLSLLGLAVVSLRGR